MNSGTTERKRRESGSLRDNSNFQQRSLYLEVSGFVEESNLL